MKQIVLGVVLMLCGSMAHAQHPYSVTRAFGTDVWPTNFFFAQNIDGTITFLTIDAPDFVAFSGSDFDRELLSPRYRAAEQAMALLARAARLVGPRRRGGRLLIQTFTPRHEVIQAALLADPGRLIESERTRRRMLRLPPFGAYAEISGVGSDEFIGSLPPDDEVMIVGDAESYVARAGDWMTLGRVLSGGERPAGSRLRIAVDPPR